MGKPAPVACCAGGVGRWYPVCCGRKAAILSKIAWSAVGGAACACAGSAGAAAGAGGSFVTFGAGLAAAGSGPPPSSPERSVSAAATPIDRTTTPARAPTMSGRLSLGLAVAAGDAVWPQGAMVPPPVAPGAVRASVAANDAWSGTLFDIPAAFSTRALRMVACGATPLITTPPAAMVPATCDPWPARSSTVFSDAAVSVTKLVRSSLGRRCSQQLECVDRIPIHNCRIEFQEDKISTPPRCDSYTCIGVKRRNEPSIDIHDS